MLAATYLQPKAKELFFGTKEEAVEILLQKKISQLNAEEFLNQRIVIKGCGETDIPGSVYFAITVKLLPYAKSIMYGEPCSTVPVYKKK
jgi:cell division ATPase FtsA